MTEYRFMQTADEGTVELRPISWPPDSILLVVKASREARIVLTAGEALTLARELTDHAERLMLAEQA